MWIDTKTLSSIVGKSPRLLQMKAKSGEISSRKKDGKSIEIDTDSLPPEWRALVAASPSVPAVSHEEGLSEYAERAIGRKLSDKERRKMEIAHFAESLVSVPESQKVSIAAGHFGVSESTVRRAIRDIAEFGVVSGERRKAVSKVWDEEAVSYLRSYYLSLLKDRNIDSKEAAWKALQSEAQKRNWAIGSRTSAFRMLKDIPEILLSYGRGGNRALDNFFYIKRSWDSVEPAGILIGDQHIADFWVVDDRDAEKPYYFRPTFYVWLDAATRCVAGIAVDEDYSSETVLNALYMAICRFGFFGATYNDNGTSECSNAVVAVVEELMKVSRNKSRMYDLSELFRMDNGRYAVEDPDGNLVDIAPDEKAWRAKHRRIYAQVKNAKAKPIERFFSTIEMKLAEKGVPGHVVTPGCPADQEEKEAAVLERQKRSGEILTLEEFVRMMIEAISEYEGTRHSSLGMSPLDKVREWMEKGWKPMHPQNRADLDFIFLSRKRVKVRKGRVTVGGIDFIGEDIRADGDGNLLDVGLTLHEGETVEVRYSSMDLSHAYAIIPDSGNGRIVRALRAVEPVEMLDYGKLSEGMEWKRRCMRTVRDSFNLLASPGAKPDERSSKLSRELSRADKALLREERKKEREEILKLSSDLPPAPRIRPYRPLFSTSFERFKWCCDMIIGNFELEERDKEFCIRYRMGEEYRENAEYWEAYMKVGGNI